MIQGLWTEWMWLILATHWVLILGVVIMLSLLSFGLYAIWRGIRPWMGLRALWKGLRQWRDEGDHS